MEDWVQIHDDDGVVSFASNVPGGALIRCYSSFSEQETMTFVPSVKVTEDGKLEGILKAGVIKL